MKNIFTFIFSMVVSLIPALAPSQANEEITPFTEVMEAVKYVRAYKGKAEDLKLPISDQMNDKMGMNMAMIADSLIAKGFSPNGFEQKSGYIIYSYKSQY